MLECNIAHRRSIAVLGMLYNIWTNQIHPHYGALPCVVCASAGYARCFGRSMVYLCASSLPNHAIPRTLILLSVSLWNDLAYPVFDGVGLAGFKSWANAILLAYKLLAPFLSSTISVSLFFCLLVCIVGMGSFD